MTVLTRYLGAAGAARIADEGARLSLVLLAVDRTGKAAVGGALVAVLLVPHVVAAPLVGVVIDRSARPRWVLAGLVATFAASLFTAAQLLGRAPLGLVVAVLLLGGCCGPAITGGLTSQLPALVGVDRAPRAFGFDSLFYNVAGMAGPALVGLVAAVAGAATAQSALAVLAGCGAAGVATLPIVTRSGLATEAPPGLLSGAREILAKRPLRIVTITSAVGQFGPGALPVVAVLIAASAGGLLLTAVAAGSFAGSALWTWRPIAPRWSALVVTVSMIGIGVPLAVAATVQSFVVVAALFAVSGFFGGPFGSALFTARTEYAAAAVRTQVFTIGAGLKVTASAAGAALIGAATGLPVGVQMLLVAAGPLAAGVAGTALIARGGDGRPRPRGDARRRPHDDPRPAGPAWLHRR